MVFMLVIPKAKLLDKWSTPSHTMTCIIGGVVNNHTYTEAANIYAGKDLNPIPIRILLIPH